MSLAAYSGGTVWDFHPLRMAAGANVGLLRRSEHRAPYAPHRETLQSVRPLRRDADEYTEMSRHFYARWRFSRVGRFPTSPIVNSKVNRPRGLAVVAAPRQGVARVASGIRICVT